MRSLNWHVLRVFSVVLIVTGILGFVLPPEMSPTSGAAPYNVFHLCFGLLGIALVVRGGEGGARVFNVGFGVIDLYQAAASAAGFFPAEWFRWKRADDVLHVLIGLGLVTVGLWGCRNRPPGPGRG